MNRTYYALWHRTVYAFDARSNRDRFVQNNSAVFVMPIKAKDAYKIVPELRYTDPTICNKVEFRRNSSLSERGNTLLGYALLLAVVGLFVYAGLGLLGIVPNVVPSMYAWIVSLFA